MKEQDTEIIELKELVITEQILSSTRRKVFNKYTIAITIVALIALLAYAILTAKQLAALQSLLQRDHYLFYWMLLTGFCAEIIAGGGSK